MKTGWFLTFIFVLGTGLSVLGQTRTQFENVLDVGSSRVFRDAQLKPRFSKAGQLCRLRLLPQAAKKKESNYARVSGETAYRILELISPENLRGSRTGNWGVGLFFGQSYGIAYEFENLMVAVAGGLGRRGENTKIFDPNNNPIFPSGEQITFTWTKRKCS